MNRSRTSLCQGQDYFTVNKNKFNVTEVIACNSGQSPHLSTGAYRGVCLAVMTGPFVLQVHSLKANKISNAVIAGL